MFEFKIKSSKIYIQHEHAEIYEEKFYGFAVPPYYRYILFKDGWRTVMNEIHV